MKSLEIQIDDRIAEVELIGREGNNFKISIDGKVQNANILMVERGVYSVILNGKSYNVELIESDGPKKYDVNTFYHNYEVEVVDAESKYLKSRKSDDSHEEAVISSPMPGKIVKIPVKVGDKVKTGDTVVIVSAMKMESEYKVKKDRVIKEIKVKEGDTITANQPLIIIE
jgi:biotin carboxyl carrier protein